ncbi:MAG: arylesterase, partial [Gammaproteobacteria bacterium]|nr:arylesterase [Gammaproteobacteria bacterium]
YTRSFHRLYTDLAAEYQIPLIPFLLDGLENRPALFQNDGIHPREEAQAIILETVWKHLASVIREQKSDVQ